MGYPRVFPTSSLVAGRCLHILHMFGASPAPSLCLQPKTRPSHQGSILNVDQFKPVVLILFICQWQMQVQALDVTWLIRHKDKTAMGHWKSFQCSKKGTQARDFVLFLHLTVDSVLSCSSHGETNHIDKARRIMAGSAYLSCWTHQLWNHFMLVFLLCKIMKLSLLFRPYLFGCPDTCKQKLS